jgi:hypothetical protein
LLDPSLLLGVPIHVEIAAAKAAVKFGSEAMAAVTVSTIEPCRCPNCTDGIAGNLEATYIGFPGSCGQPCKGKGNVTGEGEVQGNDIVVFGPCVKSRVIVGNGAEADMVAIVDA